MESIWVEQFGVSFVVGLTIFCIIFVPLVIHQYHSLGRFSFPRILGAAAVAVYFVAVVIYTFFPVPSDMSSAWCATHAKAAQTQPFYSLEQINEARIANGWSIARTLRSSLTLQLVFNIILFIPWGIIMRKYFNRGVSISILSGFLASCLIEFTQYTGDWGIFPCAYRVADVDDIITNTTGTIIGVIIAPLVLFWMPNSKEYKQTRLDPRPLSIARVWSASMINLFIFFVVSFIITIIDTFIRDESGRNVVGLDAFIVQWLIPFIIVFVLTIFGSKPGTLGQKIVWIQLLWKINHRTEVQDNSTYNLKQGSLGHRFLYLLLEPGIGIACFYISAVYSSVFTSKDQSQLAIIIFLLGLAWIFIPPLFTQKRGLGGVLSGAYPWDSRIGFTPPGHNPQEDNFSAARGQKVPQKSNQQIQPSTSVSHSSPQQDVPSPRVNPTRVLEASDQSTDPRVTHQQQGQNRGKNFRASQTDDSPQQWPSEPVAQPLPSESGDYHNVINPSDVDYMPEPLADPHTLPMIYPDQDSARQNTPKPSADNESTPGRPNGQTPATKHPDFPPSPETSPWNVAEVDPLDDQ